MRRVSLGLALVILAISLQTAFPNAAISQQNKQEQKVLPLEVMRTRIYLYAGPGIGYPVYGKAYKGDILEACGKHFHWYIVCMDNGKKAYINSIVVRPVVNRPVAPAYPSYPSGPATKPKEREVAPPPSETKTTAPTPLQPAQVPEPAKPAKPEVEEIKAPEPISTPTPAAPPVLPKQPGKPETPAPVTPAPEPEAVPEPKEAPAPAPAPAQPEPEPVAEPEVQAPAKPAEKPVAEPAEPPKTIEEQFNESFKDVDEAVDQAVEDALAQTGQLAPGPAASVAETGVAAEKPVEEEPVVLIEEEPAAPEATPTAEPKAAPAEPEVPAEPEAAPATPEETPQPAATPAPTKEEPAVAITPPPAKQIYPARKAKAVKNRKLKKAPPEYEVLEGVGLLGMYPEELGMVARFDKDEGKRANAVQMLHGRGDVAVPILIQVAQQAPNDTSIPAVEALTNIASEQGAQAMSRLLANAETPLPLRIACAKGLGEMGDSGHLTILNLVRESHIPDELRREVEKAIGALSGQ